MIFRKYTFLFLIILPVFLTGQMFTIKPDLKNELLEQGRDYAINNFPHETLDDLLESPFHHAEQNLNDYANNSSNTYWVKLNVKNEAFSNTHLITIGDPYVGDVTFYKQDDLGKFIPEKAGFDKPIQTRKIKSGTPTFILDVPIDSVETFYIKVQSKDSYNFKLRLASIDNSLNSNIYSYYKRGLFLGIIVTILSLTIFMFLYSKKRIYLYYGLFILGLVLSIDSMHIYQFIWSPLGSNLYHIYHPLEFLGMVIFYVLYVITFLDFSSKYPRLYYASLILLLLFALAFLLDYYVIETLFHYWGLTIPFIWSLVCIIFAYFQSGKKTTLFLLFGVFFCTLTFCLKILVDIGVIPNFTSWYLGDIFVWGTVIDLFFFTLALTQKYKDSQDGKVYADKRYIEQLETNRQILDHQNEKLEQIVDVKTLQLKIEKEKTDILHEELKEKISFLQEQLSQESSPDTILYEDFKNYFPDDSFCYEYLANLKNELEQECSKCGDINFSSDDKMYNLEVCQTCGHTEKVITGTLFQDIAINIREAFYLLYLYTTWNGVIPEDFIKSLTMDTNTYNKFLNRLRTEINRKVLEATEDWSTLML